ncbi:MAG: MBL fold metallo-hydrolase [Acidimicrobiales bacterium]
MAEVVILGSGTPNPDPGRAGAALAVVADQAWLLVDCGRGATQRAIDAGLDLTSLVAVAITHHHSDHLSDLATLAAARWTAGAASPLVVVAPNGPAARFARRCLDGFDDQAFHRQAPRSAGRRPAIEVNGFYGSQRVAPVLAAAGWDLKSVLVDHHPIEPAVGYVVEHGGLRVAVSGDTAVCDGLRQLARGVDVLVHETLLSSRVSPALLEWNAGARAVGALAAEARPGTLVLTHLIPAPRSPEDERAFLDEVRAGGFDGSTVVARDLLRIPIQDRPGEA